MVWNSKDVGEMLRVRDSV